MEFCTQVDINNKELGFSHKDKVLMLGSCFTDNIGGQLINAGFDCIVNPFGVLYNPISIIDALIHRTKEFYEWTQQITTHVEQAETEELSGDIYILTFGTSWIYRLKKTGHVAANCKKMPDSLFHRERLSIENIIQQYSYFIEKYIVPYNKKVIFTISPIRHKKDGFHENQLSKSLLLLATDNLCKLFPRNCYYFPAYEIMMDELRDYRFYADDMLHPSQKAVEYIWERFCYTYFDKKTLNFIAEFERLNRTLFHKPFEPEKEEYKQLISITTEKLHKLKDAVQDQ